MTTPLSGKKVAVLGLGRSGGAAARLAHSLGAVVVALDTRAHVPVPPGIEAHLGPFDPHLVVDADLLVVSPGVAAADPCVIAAQEAGVAVVGELGFAWEYIQAPSVAITGTNGKSTVTSFVGHLLGGMGRVFVGGNLGTPLSEAVLAGGTWDALVLEVSSYQLELPGGFAPDVAVVLNLTPDHLARHGTMAAYAAAKAQVFARQPSAGWSILPADDARLEEAARGIGTAPRLHLGAHPGVVRAGRVATVDLGRQVQSVSLDAVQVTGAHNLDHAATAVLLCLALGAELSQVEARLGGLRALPHRTAPVHEADGVVWIDDSKATNVASTKVAVAGLERPAVVLLGGQGKDGDDVGELLPLLGRHRAVITFGADREAMASRLRGAPVPVIVVDDLGEAVAMARAHAQHGDAVLLSPAAASFDAFKDFADRGRVFAGLARGDQPTEIA